MTYVVGIVGVVPSSAVVDVAVAVVVDEVVADFIGIVPKPREVFVRKVKARIDDLNNRLAIY